MHHDNVTRPTVKAPARRKVRMLCQALLLAGLSVIANAQYSDDLKDIAHPFDPLHNGVGDHTPSPIADLGPVELVVDLRGFIPMSRISAEATSLTNPSKGSLYPLRWYKIPTQKAVQLLYTGELSMDHVADDTSALESSRFAHTRFLRESQAQGDAARWCRLAFDLTEHGGKALYADLIGGS